MSGAGGGWWAGERAGPPALTADAAGRRRRGRGPVERGRGRAALGKVAEARDFVTDAVAHNKFLALGPDASGLIEAAGVASKKDDGFVDVSDAAGAKGFVETCRALRFWKRELSA